MILINKTPLISMSNTKSRMIKNALTADHSKKERFFVSWTELVFVDSFWSKRILDLIHQFDSLSNQNES
jgi:hypothetical protein